MHGFFNPENKAWDFIGKLADVCCMSILWLVTSLPIVTVGAATTAFYDFTIHQVNDREGAVLGSYFKSFGKYFKRATALWLVELAALVFFGVDVYAAWQYFTATNGSIWAVAALGITACALLLVIMSSLYAYPILATFDFSVKKILSNCFIMAVANLPVTVVILLIYGLAAVGMYYLSGVFFLFFGLAVFASSYFLFAVFQKYTGEPAEDPAAPAKK